MESILLLVSKGDRLIVSTAGETTVCSIERKAHSETLSHLGTLLSEVLGYDVSVTEDGCHD